MTCWSVDDFELTVCSFPFKGWKVGWCDKRIDNNVDVFGSGGECFRDSSHIPPLPLELMVMLELA